MRIALGLLIVVVVLVGSFGPGVGATMPIPEDQKALIRQAIDAAEDDDWKKVRLLSVKITQPLAVKFLRWLDMSRPNSDHSFEEISAFVAANPDWPSSYNLTRRAEEALTVTTPSATILKWFADHEPVSGDGDILLIRALFDVGRDQEAKERLRKAWINGNFGARQEKQFFNAYRKYLTSADHEARLDRLLWEDRDGAARRMFWKVGKDIHKLAEARWMLAHRRGNVDAAVNAVPKSLSNHPGLIYERIRWRRRAGNTEGARELMRNAPKDMVVPEKWWVERSILARDSLQRGFITDAYRIAAAHGTEPGSSAFAEAEWMAGWIALRFLEDSEIALKHFVTMFNNVQYPISRARGAYWAGRAAQTIGDKAMAESWYRTAAGNPTTYYGQLAMARLPEPASLRLPPEPSPSEAEVKAFRENGMVKVLRILDAVEAQQHMRPFFTRLADMGDEPGWRVQVSALALETGRPDMAVAVAKQASRNGHELIEGGYPTIALPLDQPEPPLVLALIRQESAFQVDATSRVGARGLMQLMPQTAKTEARGINVRYSKALLLKDAEYNLRLGQTHLAGLLEKFDGSYVLAVAAYNAGGSRVRQWIREYGDPRDGTVDVVDWVETIPFDETRNYVQRVLESTQVYRQRLMGTEIALNIEGDLKR